LSEAQRLVRGAQSLSKPGLLRKGALDAAKGIEQVEGMGCLLDGV
jgi:hypothetical protein